MSILRMKDGGKTAELLIYDVIGVDFWTGDGLTAKNVLSALNEAGNVETIEVRINSPGGNVSDGAAIYHALHRHNARIVVEVDGHALSAASVIAMAGDEIRMAANAMMMIHEAWGGTSGNAADHEATAVVLRKLTDSAAAVYAARTGVDKDEVLRLLAAETWFTADEAVERGFATSIVAAKGEAQSRFDPKWRQLRQMFRHDPDDVRRLKRGDMRSDAPRQQHDKTNATPKAPQSKREALVPTALGKLASERLRVRLGDL